MKDILDLHTHTTASGHAYNTLYEMIQSAANKHLALYGCSDHGPAIPGAPNQIYFVNFRVIPRELFGIKVLMGAELNILNSDGSVDLKENTLKKLDYGIASLHLPSMKPGTIEENTSAYLHVMENPYIQIIGHPDDGRYPTDYKALVLAAKKHHKLLELNNSSLHPQCSRLNSRENYRTILSLCMEYEVPIIINSDAHIEADVGNHQAAHQFLEELSFPEELVVNTSMEKLLPYIPSIKRFLES